MSWVYRYSPSACVCKRACACVLLILVLAVWVVRVWNQTCRERERGERETERERERGREKGREVRCQEWKTGNRVQIPQVKVKVKVMAVHSSASQPIGVNLNTFTRLKYTEPFKTFTFLSFMYVINILIKLLKCNAKKNLERHVWLKC